LTFQELTTSLPNGLHDAELLNVAIDYAGKQVIFDLNLDASLNDNEPERYRPARVTFSGVVFVSIDPPPDAAMRVSTISAGSGQPMTAPIRLPDISKDCFLCWVFVVRSNSFIRLAARTVTHEWVDVGGPA
jgi:hypothetical protein